jgi:hypothetical protein
MANYQRHTINLSVRTLMIRAIAFNQFLEILSTSISALNGIPSNRLYGCCRYEHSIERCIPINLKSLHTAKVRARGMVHVLSFLPTPDRSFQSCLLCAHLLRLIPELTSHPPPELLSSSYNIIPRTRIVQSARTITSRALKSTVCHREHRRATQHRLTTKPTLQYTAYHGPSQQV